MSTIRVVFVHRGYVTPLEIPRDSEGSTLHAMQTLVGGLIERIVDYQHKSARHTGTVDVFANEEAYLIEPEAEADIEPVTEAMVVGPYFYVGSDDRGASISLTENQINEILDAHGKV
jgi:hypothetical protein